MAKIIVLFNLKPGISVADYEALPSVRKFEVLRSQGLLGGGTAPYQYVEILDLHSLEALGADVATEMMQKVAATFQSMAQDPQFIITESL
jgi:hypothetical protein